MREEQHPLETLALPQSRDELLLRIEAARSILDGTLAAITEDELGDLRDGAGWATVDHLSHIAAWERMIAAHVTDGSEHEVAGIDRARFETLGLEELNNVLYHRMRGRSLPEALREYREAHEAIVALLRTLDERRFGKPYWDDEPSGRTVMDKAAGDTYLHYLEHNRWILELVRG